LAATWPLRRAAHGRLQRDVDHLAGKTLKSRSPRSGRSMPGEDTSSRLYSMASTSSANCSWRVTFSQSSTVDKLLHLHGLPRQIDRDAQQATGRAVDLDQVVAQSGHGLLNDVL
jgi:hypothetical protein